MMEATEITAYPYCNGLLLEDKPHNFRETQSIIWIHMVGIIGIYILYPHYILKNGDIPIEMPMFISQPPRVAGSTTARAPPSRHVGVPGAPLHRGGSGGGCTRKVEKFSLCHLEKWNQLGLCGACIYI